MNSLLTYIDHAFCRICKTGKLEHVLSLGNHYVVTFIDPAELPAWKRGEREPKIPLTLMICSTCKFVQLRETVNQDRLYRKFWYRSSTNESMCRQLREIVDEASAKAQLKNQRFQPVLDIGCNDGQLLSYYSDTIMKVGFDPAVNLTAEAKDRAGTEFILADYFSDRYEEDLRRLAPGGFRVITAISMFYDLPDPMPFLRAVKKALHPDGVFVIQMNYLLSMIEQNAVDNIAHEHLGYYSLAVLKSLVEACGMQVRDASVNDTNGGSIRVYVNHTGPTTNDEYKRVSDLLQIELGARLDDPQTYRKFEGRIETIKSQLREAIYSYAGSVYLYGASTRGSTLMQLLDIGGDAIVGAAERNPEKVGKLMVGTWIPIVSEEHARKAASMFLVLPWHFKSSILERERKTLEEGEVKFLFPFPSPCIYSADRLM